MVALALALRDAGHRVKVFGVGQMAPLFRHNGLDFEAHDLPVVAHRGNAQARAWLQKRAQLVGLEGDGIEEECWLDVFMTYQEFAQKLSQRLWRMGVPPPEIVRIVLQEADAKWKLLLSATEQLELAQPVVDNWRKTCLQWQAEDAKMSIEEVLPLWTERCAAFRRFVRGVASELLREPLEMMESLHAAFSIALLDSCSKLADNRGEQAKMVDDAVRDFFAWQQGEDLAEYWKRWRARLRGWETAAAVLKSVPSVTTTMNLLFALGDASPDEKPKLVVYHFSLASAALALRVKHGVSTCIAWTQTHYLQRQPQVEYLCGVLEELSNPNSPSAVKEVGPFGFLGILQGPRQLVSSSPLMLNEDGLSRDWRRHQTPFEGFKSCWKGEWALSETHADTSLIGTEADKSLLEKFLAACEAPPVCFGWGSTPLPSGRGAEHVASMVVKTLRLVGRRGIYVAGLSGLDHASFAKAIRDVYGEAASEAEGRVLFLTVAPYDWLFPRCACVVHHGGLGTCHTALRAGVPMVIVPVGFDQPSNAKQVERLGCGVVTPKSLQEMTAENLSMKVLEVLHNAGMATKAKEVSEKIKAELGAVGAAELIAGFLSEDQERGSPHPELVGSNNAQPWVDGRYVYIHPSGARTPLVMSFKKGGLVIHQGRVVGCVRHGDFISEEEGKEAPYTVQSIWITSRQIAFGNLSSDGKTFTWADGGKHVFEHPDE